MTIDVSGGEDDGVAERMADAILYLSAVAERSGLDAVAQDLMSVRGKLLAQMLPKAPEVDEPPAHAKRRKACGVRR
ncbi:hypothetical protein [Bradyrhizobium japonicum]|uniref:hypothetical protein n=1 Tax=Bradyrhizobium japonicum TaxID=375 RepID=UPI001BABE514|nr:hypothetical protein [Bradyrhizobium japonicum]MBR0911469.1 hypothetical protein [Bradyrhizobium japonicum]